MLRSSDSAERQIQKLQRINAALIRRMDIIDEARGSTHALSQAAAVLEREVVARNLDLERALADLGAINAELASARVAADEANRAKSRFLRAASHDLLQPLSAAKLLLSHLEDVTTDPGQADLVGRIAATFESAEDLIRALLQIARLDSQRVEMNVGPVSLGRLFQRLSIDVQAQAEARGLDLRFVPSSAAVLSDPVHLRSIAQNLISNALKYTVSGRVLVGVRRAPGGVWLQVHDTGPGIAAKDQERIFNEFERLSHSDQPGTGLGLTIVRRACQQLGHPLEVLSAPGRGSLFRVLLPLAGAAALAPDRVADAREAPGPDALFQDRTVLVVENDPAMRQAFSFLLGSWGMTVLATDGIDGVGKLLQGPRPRPEIVLTDYRLDQGETGVQVISQVHAALGRAVPALIVSAECAETIGAASSHLGAGVLEKPVAEADLRQMMRALLTAAP